MTDDLPPLKDVIDRYDLAAKKSLGQNFLLDLNITRKIARAADIGRDDAVLEIGPGPGGLTRALLETGARVVAVERDARCVEALGEIAAHFDNRLTVVSGDAMTADERALLTAPAKIVANLPYNISTALLIKWLRLNHESDAPFWSTMALMFQKEVADRIVAPPGGKAYGRLSVIAQAAAQPSRAFNLPARAFTPPPKVDSSVVLFAPAPLRLPDLKALESVTQAGFAQRRKMLRSSLRAVFGDETEAAIEAAGAKATARAEEISVATWLTLAARLISIRARSSGSA